MWEEGVYLLHDNAPPHTSNVAKDAITELVFTELLHPPYSPDLAPSDYFLFPNLKKDLRNKAFSSDDAVENAIKRWMTKNQNHSTQVVCSVSRIGGKSVLGSRANMLKSRSLYLYLFKSYGENKTRKYI